MKSKIKEHVDNTGKKKKSKEREDGNNYPHEASFRQNLSKKSKEDVIVMTVALWQKYEELSDAYKRLMPYSNTAIALLLQNGIDFPTIGEYKEYIKKDKIIT